MFLNIGAKNLPKILLFLHKPVDYMCEAVIGAYPGTVRRKLYLTLIP